MTNTDSRYARLRQTLSAHGQQHLLRFWDELSEQDRDRLAEQLESFDFDLIERLTKHWIVGEPDSEAFESIEPVSAVPHGGHDPEEHRQALSAGETALRNGRVGLVLVAGGQGTRLGYDGPKGTYPIGPVTGRSLFAFHADKIHSMQRRYECTLPWYIMVGETNKAATKQYFEQHRYFDLDPAQVRFFTQDMMPSVDENGKVLLESKGSVAENPNGHGGCIPALVERGILNDARERGIDTLSYFQVDNWAVRVADPVFIGYHLLRGGSMSSKVHRKKKPRESAGVFCVCDGKVRVIEYTELDIYPQLLKKDEDGNLIHWAANAAIHVIDVDFIQQVYDKFCDFPWHCSHKKIPYIDDNGNLIEPEQPNGYKFETFIFDALQYCEREQLTYELDQDTEFAAVKQAEGDNSPASTRAYMRRIWARWLEAAGYSPPPDVAIEISPRFARTEEEFVERTRDFEWPEHGDIAIGPDGELIRERRRAAEAG